MSSNATISPILYESVATIARSLRKYRDIERCLQSLVMMRVPVTLIEKFKLKRRVEKLKKAKEYKNLAEMALQKMAMAEKSDEKAEEPEKNDRKRRNCDKIGGPEAKKKPEDVAAPIIKKSVSKKPLAAGYKAPAPQVLAKTDSHTFRIPKRVSVKPVEVKENVREEPKALMSLDIEVPEKYRQRTDLDCFFKWIKYGNK